MDVNYDHIGMAHKLRNNEAHVSHSQIMKYTNCPKAWWYYIIAKLRMNRVETVIGKRTLGKLIHMGLAQIIMQRIPGNENLLPIDKMYEIWLQEVIEEAGGVLPEELDMLNDLVEQATYIVPKVIKEIGINDNWETLVDKDGTPIIEYEINAQLPNGVHLLGYIDWGIRDTETGKIILIDFKTTGSKKRNYDGDIQVSAIYNKALQQLGVIDGHAEAMIIEINAKELKRPKQNKNGDMSMAQLHTTWEIYKKELIECGLDPDDYLAMRRKLMDVKFVKTHRVFKTEVEVESIWENRNNIVNNIIEALEKDDIMAFPANLNNLGCSFCEYAEACREDIAGYGYEDLVEAGVYVIKEWEDDIEEEDTEDETSE